MTETVAEPAKKSQELKRSLVVRMAEKYNVDESKLMETLKSTAFKQRDGSAPTNEQMMALMVVADQYDLNPFIKEIYAFPDKFNQGIIPVVGVDGWSRIINQHPFYDGIEYNYSDEMVLMHGAQSEAHAWIEAIIYRKDRSRPTKIREYLDECYKPPGVKPGPWQTHPKRFLRHKALIQCARIALGFVGIYDLDEAENILGNTIDARTQEVAPSKAPGAMLEHKKMEELLTGLVNRCREDGSWHGAQQLVQERFHDQPELLKAASKRLHKAEVDYQLDSMKTTPPAEREEEEKNDLAGEGTDTTVVETSESKPEKSEKSDQLESTPAKPEKATAKAKVEKKTSEKTPQQKATSLKAVNGAQASFEEEQQW